MDNCFRPPVDVDGSLAGDGPLAENGPLAVNDRPGNPLEDDRDVDR